MKKILSVIMCLTILLGISAALPYSASAATNKLPEAGHMTDLASSGSNISVMPVRDDDYPSKYSVPAKDSVVDEWNFLNRECTSFCAWRLNSRNGVAFNNYYKGVHWGDAYNWGSAARSVGITVDNTPAVGSVAWSSSGHVAWVNAVNSDGTVVIEEYNTTWQGVQDETGRYLSRVVTADHFTGYIHISDMYPRPLHRGMERLRKEHQGYESRRSES